LGGRAWPNVQPYHAEHESALLLWANSTLGTIVFWWLGTRQQQGRACFTIGRVPNLPVLDPRKLSPAQLATCNRMFAELKESAFLPANEAWRDGTRQELDRRLLVDVLGFNADDIDGLELLRLQWCAEPSVHGGKPTRPPGGGLASET